MPHLQPVTPRQALDASVVIPTYNRADRLAPLLARLLDQDAGGVRYEVLVVDNHSTDHTKEVVQRAIDADGSARLRYTFEPRRGAPHARNAGIEQTTAPLILFLDDDGIPGRDWVRGMAEAFARHPEADCIGGRVKTEWRVPPPSWMQEAHTGPIALQDWPEAIYVNAGNAARCLITANLGFRREVFARIGGFSPDFLRNEDRELELRMWRAGMQGLYLPALDVTVDVPPERLTRRYHRRWRAESGRYSALMRYRDHIDRGGALVDDPRRGRTLLDVPLFIYREFLSHIAGWLRSALSGRGDERFLHETRIWFYVGYVLERWRNRMPSPLSGVQAL